MERHRLVRVDGEVSEPLELDDLAWSRVPEGGLDLAASEHFARGGGEIVEDVARCLTRHRCGEQPLVQRDRRVDRVGG